MATYTNNTGAAIDVPSLGLHVPDGDTFEIPDAFRAAFDANPGYTSSRAKNPDAVPDPAVVEAAVTGTVPVIPAAPTGDDAISQ